jgi:hypothetical protein
MLNLYITAFQINARSKQSKPEHVDEKENLNDEWKKRTRDVEEFKSKGRKLKKEAENSCHGSIFT